MRRPTCHGAGAALLWIVASLAGAAEPAAPTSLVADIQPLLRQKCVKCHGPAKQEGGLNLSTPGALARGGESGSAIHREAPRESLLWQRVSANEMPPEEPLSAEEKQLLERWLSAGAPGLPTAAQLAAAGSDHWAFARLTAPTPPAATTPTATPIDRFIAAALQARGLSMNPPADRATLIRRVSFDLIGLPPTPAEVRAYLDDTSPDAYARMVERYLASPRYGERWGKYWLDAAGYADSNGYFNADSDRPLAHRYRDYVIRAINQDKPFDRFVLEQIAGDELSGFEPGNDATPEMISLLEATHFLRNGQDGSGESDGNEEEVLNDRYYALESAQQIIGSSLLGLTLQCAKCHDHKFEPVTQRQYYELQAVLYPAFNVKKWRKPNDRFVMAHLPGELDHWKQQAAQLDAEIAALRETFNRFVRENRPPSKILFQDDFETTGPALADAWSAAAPGDEAPGGKPPVTIDSDQAPAAQRRDGKLLVIESGAAGDRLLSTKQSFDWTPDGQGEWIQVTFDLVDNRVGQRNPAERIGYFIALHDFNDVGVAGGNILIDGNPAGAAAVHLDYPGGDTEPLGDVGTSKYEPGHNYGVRITNAGKEKFLLEHLVDGMPDAKSLTVAGKALPDGGFGFEYCCGRSFVVDNVVVERSVTVDEGGAVVEQSRATLQAKQQELAAAVKEKEKQRTPEPGKISCVTDGAADPPEVFLQVRGNHLTPGEAVAPAPLAAIAETGASLAIQPVASLPSTGRRLAWAQWLMAKDSRSAALVARVQANRLWRRHFGAGLVTTTENLGTTGAPPSHPELLEYLASEFIRSGWSLKSMHRQLLSSAVYQQSSAVQEAAHKADPDNRLWWRFSIQRLDAEALRDSMLAVSGELDPSTGGPYVPTTRDSAGEVLVAGDTAGALRRSIYLQQRRTQTLSLLNVFDSPSIVFNCVERATSTMPLQSLSLLNSDFVVARATAFAQRLITQAGPTPQERIETAYLATLARSPSADELRAATEFLAAQQAQYQSESPDDPASSTEQRAIRDFCHMLLASNAFLYVE